MTYFMGGALWRQNDSLNTLADSGELVLPARLFLTMDEAHTSVSEVVQSHTRLGADG